MDALKAEQIRDDLQLALDAIAEKHGVSVSPVRGAFTNLDIKITCVFSDKVAGEHTNPELVRNLKRNGCLYGLTVEHLNKTVNIGSRHGLAFRGLRGKKAIFADPNGRLWMYDAAQAADYLRRA